MERVPPMKLVLRVKNIELYKGVSPPQFILNPPPPGPKQDTYPPGTYNYQRNKEVTITAPEKIGATPRTPEWIFDHWEGDAEGDSPQITITMNADKQIVACFREGAPPISSPIIPPPSPYPGR